VIATNWAIVVFIQRVLPESLSDTVGTNHFYTNEVHFMAAFVWIIFMTVVLCSFYVVNNLKSD